MSNFAPTVTTGLVLFNVIIFVLITAFASDDMAIGQASNVYEEIDETGNIDDVNVKDVGFMERFWIILWDLPWWINVFVIFMNVLLIPITIFAWIRGL